MTQGFLSRPRVFQSTWRHEQGASDGRKHVGKQILRGRTVRSHKPALALTSPAYVVSILQANRLSCCEVSQVPTPEYTRKVIER